MRFRSLIRSVLVCVLIMSCGVLRADEVSGRVLEKLNRQVRAAGDYRVEFSLNGARGELTVGGERFVMKVARIELFFDGRTLWGYNRKRDEVVVENFNGRTSNPLANPARLLALDPEQFKHETIGTNRVKLTPVDARGGDFRYIELTVNSKTSLPERIVVKMDNETLDIRIIKFVSGVTVSEGMFVFNKAEHPKVAVIDMR